MQQHRNAFVCKVLNKFDHKRYYYFWLPGHLYTVQKKSIQFQGIQIRFRTSVTLSLFLKQLIVYNHKIEANNEKIIIYKYNLFNKKNYLH